MQNKNIQTILILTLLLLVGGCKGKKKQANDSTAGKQSTQNIATEKVEEQVGFTGHALMFLKEEKGSYPRASGILENEELKSRLQFLLKEEMDSLLAFWNVETPIQNENDVVLVSGCQQHNCPAHQYFLVVDLNLNSINVLVFKHSDLIIYAEKDLLELPGKLHLEMQTVKNNAGVTAKSTKMVSLINQNK